MIQYYEVGGAVRDRIRGARSKDVDFAVEADSYQAMVDDIKNRGGFIFLESPQHLTVRARMPLIGPADFVLCRSDGRYIDGRHPETVTPGDIYDDLARRGRLVNGEPQATGAIQRAAGLLPAIGIVSVGQAGDGAL